MTTFGRRIAHSNYSSGDVQEGEALLKKRKLNLDKNTPTSRVRQLRQPRKSE